MSIEISGSGTRPPVDMAQTNAADNKTASAYNNAPQGSGGAADKLSLTNQAAQMQQLEAQIAEAPVVDTQRVQDVQHSIATNSLQSEPAEVANKLLNFEAGLAQPSAGSSRA